jgi:hypothetical protein
VDERSALCAHRAWRRTRQNTASDDYHKWDNKADAYIAVLSILAISALVVMSLAAAWTGFILIL